MGRFYDENEFTISPPEYSIFTQHDTHSGDDLFDSPSAKKYKLEESSDSTAISNPFLTCKSTSEDINANRREEDFDINENTLDMFSSPKPSKMGSNSGMCSDSQDFYENVCEQETEMINAQDIAVTSSSQILEGKSLA